MRDRRPRWTPADIDEAEADLHAGRIEETHHFEAKQAIENGAGGNSKIGKALSAFSNDGGTLAIGVAENKSGIPDRVTPVP